MSKLVIGKSKPIGELQDFKCRIEFQKRDHPTVMLLWVKMHLQYHKTLLKM
jgi:hypothetical protein